MKIFYFVLALFFLNGCQKEEVKNDFKDEKGDVIITLSKKTREVSPYLAGYNGRSTEGPSWKNSGFINLVREMNPMCVRYPAGTQANYWDWRTGGMMNKSIKYRFSIPDFINGLPDYTQVIYVVNMARPTPITGYRGNESDEVLKSTAMLNAKIDDMLMAIEEFGNNNRLPVAVEFGNEFYFDNEHAAIYANNPDLYIEHSKIISQRLSEFYPTIKLILCCTKGGTTKRDYWNNKIYNALKADKNFAQQIYGVVQHHYINDKFGSQTPIDSNKKAEAAIQEGWDYISSVQKDYNDVPDNLKLWITEYGITKKPEEASMWCVGMQYLALGLGWIDCGEKVDNISCHHITNEPGVIDKNAMKLGPVAIANKLLMESLQNKERATTLNFSQANGTNHSLKGWAFIGNDATDVLLFNGTQEAVKKVNISKIVNDKRVMMIETYSDRPFDKGSKLGKEIIQTKKEITSETLIDVQPFSIVRLTSGL